MDHEFLGIKVTALFLWRVAISFVTVLKQTLEVHCKVSNILGSFTYYVDVQDNKLFYSH